MTSRRDILRGSIARLKQEGIPATANEVEWLLLEAAGLKPVDLIVDPDAIVAQTALDTFERMLNRRLKREPVQYILGHTEFFGYRFSVNPTVLIPRPETEQLVERALDHIEKDSVVVDLGTGSGCIAISIKKKCPEALVIGIDVSEQALKTARKNALDLEAKVHFLSGDIFDMGLAGQVQSLLRGRDVRVLLSNPPYIPTRERTELEPEVALYEPSVALFCDGDGLDVYRAIAALGKRLLAENGILLAETHMDSGEAVRAEFEHAGYLTVQLYRDLSEKDRIVFAKV